MSSLKILVIKPSSLGDIIQTLQVIEGLYEAAKNQGITLKIHWIVREIFAEILHLSPFIEKYFIFNRNGGIKGFYQLMKTVRKESYDWVFDFQGLLRSGLMTFLTRSKHKIGRKDAREGSRIFYTETFAPKEKIPHAVEILQALLQPLKFPFQPKRPITLNLKSNCFNLPQNTILLFPNSRGPKKEWPYFYELTELLLQKTNYYCSWVGQQAFTKYPKHIHFINLIGQTQLSDLPTLIQNASCIIANDSGPIHLAAALKKPLIGLYGPTDANRYGPYPIKNHCILQALSQKIAELSIDNVLSATIEYLSKL